MVTKIQQLSSPQVLSDDIVQLVKTSNLHFVLQETPYSVYITLRKKLLLEDSPFQSVKDYSGSESLKTTLTKFQQKCEDLHQVNAELENMIDDKDSLAHKLEMKLEKAKVETCEALKKANDAEKDNQRNLMRLNNLIGKNKIADDELKVFKVENENLKNEVNHSNKALNNRDKEVNKLSKKIDNLEENVKNLKQKNKDLTSEEAKTSKENSKAQKQLTALKARRPSSSSKGTTTLSSDFSSDASTSTVLATTFSASSNTTQVAKSSKSSQTNHHPDLVTLPPIFSSHLVPTNSSSLDPTNKSRLDPTNKSSLDPTNKNSLDPTNKSSLDPTNKSSLDPINKSTLDPTNKSTLDHTNKSTLDPTNKSCLDPTNMSSLDPTNNSILDPYNSSSLVPSSLAPTKSPNNIYNEDTEDYAEVLKALMEFSTKVDALGVRYQEFSEELKKK